MTNQSSFGGYDPFLVIKQNRDAYIYKWSEDYDGNPNSSWDKIFDEVENEFETYADDEASSDGTSRTLIERFDDGEIDEYDMDNEFDQWVEWLDLSTYDYND